MFFLETVKISNYMSTEFFFTNRTSNNIYKIIVNNQEFFFLLVFLFLEFCILEFFFFLKIISFSSMNIFLIEKSNQHLCFSRKLILNLSNYCLLLKKSITKWYKSKKDSSKGSSISTSNILLTIVYYAIIEELIIIDYLKS